MTRKRDLSFCPLVLSVLVVFSTVGCDMSSPSDQSQSGLADVQREVTETKRTRDDAAAKVEQARQKYEALKQKAESLSQKSVENKKASSVDDPKLDDTNLSPNTAPARKKAADALTELNDAIQAKDKAELASRQAQDKFENARARGEQARNQDRAVGETKTPLLLYILIPLLILLPIGLLAFFFWRKLDVIEDRIARTLGKIREHQDALGVSVGTLSKGLGKLHEEVAGVQQSLTQLRVSTDQTGDPVSGETDQQEPVVLVAAEIEPTPPDFPTTVNDYFARPRLYVTAVKPDRIKGMLVKDADGQLMLVHGTGEYQGRLLAIPRTPRFKTVQDYNNHFEKYYDCFRPSSGGVLIDSPAIVTEVDGGWELDIKGLLEIR